MNRLYADITICVNYRVDIWTNIAGIRNELIGIAELLDESSDDGHYYFGYACHTYENALEVEQIVRDCLTVERLLANVQVAS